MKALVINYRLPHQDKSVVTTVEVPSDYLFRSGADTFKVGDIIDAKIAVLTGLTDEDRCAKVREVAERLAGAGSA